MPLRAYGMLTGRALDRRREGATDTPHYQVHVLDGAGKRYRIAVNVLSQQSPSELLYLVDDDLRHPVTEHAAGLGDGWHPLPRRPGAANLDFVRGNLFDPADLRTLPPDVDGPDNDLADLLDHYVLRAVGDPDARVHVLGERWGPEQHTPDKVFGFLPGNGVHDIHMNQGNSERFRGDDGVWQDGGVLLHFPREDRWVGIFLAFQSQSWHTDDATGHAIPQGPTTRDGTDVRILAAMVNPRGGAPEREWVLLLNTSPDPVDLARWRLSDQARNTCPVPDVVLPAGQTLLVPVTEPAHLSNKGGAATLLDAGGRKVAGIAYTRDQAAREGWTLTF
jgi:uncharacterized protein YukJ